MLYDRKMLKQLKENYLTALAMEQTIAEQVKEIKTDILAANAFYVAEEWQERRGAERIDNPAHDYLMNDDDFSRYVSMCYEVYKRQGIADERGVEYIPGAKEENLRKVAEQMILDFALSIMPEALAEQRETLRRNLWKIDIRNGVLDGILRLEC